MLAATWHDFVMYPDAPGRATRRADRDPIHAADPGARLVAERDVIDRGEHLVALHFGEYGSVLLWTSEHVCVVYQAHHAGKELLVKVERNPPATASRRWITFVRHPLNPERVHTREDRLNLGNAVPMPAKGEVFGEKHPRAFIVGERDYPILPSEVFEAMYLDDGGGVKIWTNKTAYVLERTVMERFVLLPRDPTEMP